MIARIIAKINRIIESENKKKLFQKQFELFKQLDVNKRLVTKQKDWYPCLGDNTLTTGFDAHYIYHPAWAARIVKQINPSKHVDISSTLHFSTILSAFVPVNFYDYRPALLNLSNLNSDMIDLTQLSFESNSIPSLSCMHTVEHIGLGRYGDPIDPEGDVKAIKELKRVVKIGGSLLFVTPVGIPRVMFNAHRIYNPYQIIDSFKGFSLQQFSLITDAGEFIDDASFDLGLNQWYGCGCFWFTKEQ